MSFLVENSSAFHPVVPPTSTVTTTEVTAMMQTLAALQPLMSQTTTVTSLDSQMLPITLFSTPQNPFTTLSINTSNDPILTYVSPTTVTQEPAHQQLTVLQSQLDNFLLATILNLSLSPNVTTTLPIMSQEQIGIADLSQFSPAFGSRIESTLLLDNPILPQSPISISPVSTAEHFQFRRFSASDAQISQSNRSQENRRYSDFLVDAMMSPTTGFFVDMKARNPRKQRTIYGPRQTEALEEEFRNHSYTVGNEREALAARLGLSEAQVRVWFQNRRSKHRKIANERRNNGSDKE